MCVGGDSGGSTVSSTEPPAYALPYLTEVAQEASDIYNTQDYTYYSGDTVANLTPDQLAAQDSLRDAAGAIMPLISGYQAAAQDALSIIDLENDPLVGEITAGITNPLMRKLQQDILPGLRSGATEAGQYGGSRQGIAEGLAVQGTSEVAADAVSRALASLYETDVAARTAALNNATDITNLSSIPALYLNAIGSENQAQDQAEIDAALDQFFYEQSIDINALMDYANILAGTTFGGTSTTESSSSGNSTGDAIAAIGALASIFS